ncbi:DUF3221 domain-containing protein [Sporosarcina sp. D27]|uniref:DUF3221 domain-containing protein n=1 Tax=Sporosarcina sp. D27 TaxID=1382305 RepID=UPI0004723ACB|nr:DUF3221 domain-containing protein [Sporosarcina sp. D27]
MKNMILMAGITIALLLGGCGTAGTDRATDISSVKQDDGGTIKTVSGRDIIAELKQSVEESPQRDLIAQEQLTSTDYTDGYFGKPSKELEEDVAVQAIEGPVAINAVEEVYGADGGFDKEGLLFFENQHDGAAQSGIWIGLKDPDTRLQQVLDILQQKVDAGEILAEPIYIFRSPHTQHELYVKQDKVAKAVDELFDDRGSYSVSVDTISGAISIGHDFLKTEQQQVLEKQFPDYALNFKQEGSMVAEPGQSSIIKPKKIETETPVEEGGFVLETSNGSFLVAGGTEGAVSYSFPEADQLTVGQRVKVEATGAIAESYPGQGTAKFVEILPDYRPAGAMISESQVVEKAIQENANDFIVIDKVSFDTARSVWTLTLNDERVLEIEDR